MKKRRRGEREGGRRKEMMLFYYYNSLKDTCELEGSGTIAIRCGTKVRDKQFTRIVRYIRI
jgi:hypothetical protein